MASDEKSVVNFIEDPLYMMSYFSLAAFRVLSLSSDNSIIMCLSVALFELVLLGFIEFYECLDLPDLLEIDNITFRLKFLSFGL